MVPSNAGRSSLIKKRAPPSNERARKVDSAWEIFAPAKLNLYLEVLGLRGDGFRALETLMIPVRIYDQLLWRDGPPTAESESAGSPSTTSGSVTLRVRNLLPNNGTAALLRGDARGSDSQQGDVLLGESSDNLVLRAGRLLAQTAGIAPRGRFDLVKRIPIQAGMGGGSSDAAAALLLANNAWGLGYSRQQLLPLATQLGSDVPFFLSRSAAICRGRGELVELVAGLPRLHFVVVKPAAGLSTPEVFGKLSKQSETDKALARQSHSRLSQLVDRLQHGKIAAAGQVMSNSLEAAASQLAPWLEQLRETMVRLGCLGHFMTGSGSAYVGVMRSATHARNSVGRLVSLNNQTGLKLGNVFATSSC